MHSFDPKDLSTGRLHGYLLSAVAPRPIAFASTIDKDGNPNLSPFSFFNVFGANPPIMIFSPARSVRNNTTKHTLENAQATKEVVINVVNYDIVHQMSLSSTAYATGVNEFPRFSRDGDAILFIKNYKGQSAIGIIRLNYNKNYLFPLKYGKVQSMRLTITLSSQRYVSLLIFERLFFKDALSFTLSHLL